MADSLAHALEMMHPMREPPQPASLAPFGLTLALGCAAGLVLLALAVAARRRRAGLREAALTGLGADARARRARAARRAGGAAAPAGATGSRGRRGAPAGCGVARDARSPARDTSLHGRSGGSLRPCALRRARARRRCARSRAGRAVRKASGPNDLPFAEGPLPHTDEGRMRGRAAAHPSPACGRRWPDEVGSDEGTRRLSYDPAASGNSPHPTPLCGATFSRKREKEEAAA